jgi:hypothetical protein
MQATAVSLLLSGISRDALKFVVALIATALAALLLVVLLLLSLVDGAAGALAGGRSQTPWAAALLPVSATDAVLAPTADGTAGAVIAAARTQLGRPYVWAARISRPALTARA